MERPKRSRRDWVEAGLESLGEVGVDKVRVDRIAATLGVTKGSFYWHFKDRADLLDAIVDAWEEQGTEALINTVDSSGTAPMERARYLWKLANGERLMGAELAIRDWARRDNTIAELIRRVDDRRMSYVEALLAEIGLPHDQIGSRSLLVYSLLIGDYLIATSHPSSERRRIVEDALTLLISPG